MDREQLLAIRHQDVAAVFLMALFGGQAIHQGDRGPKGARDVLWRYVRVAQMAGIMQERQEKIEKQLTVGFTAHVLTEELRLRSEQPFTQPLETEDGAGLSE